VLYLVNKNKMNNLKRIYYFYFPVFTKRTSYSVRHQFLQTNRSFLKQSIRNIHISEGHTSGIVLDEIRNKINTKWKYSEGYTCLKINCPSCFLNDTAQKGVINLCELSINSKTGNVFCTRCFLHGSWQAFDTYLHALEKSKGGNGLNSSRQTIFSLLQIVDSFYSL